MKRKKVIETLSTWQQWWREHADAYSSLSDKRYCQGRAQGLRDALDLLRGGD